MGWAARANEQRGNPTPAPMSTKMLFISDQAHLAAFLGRRTAVPAFARVAFSDRQYTIDVFGTLRRAPAVAVEANG